MFILKENSKSKTLPSQKRKGKKERETLIPFGYSYYKTGNASG